MVLDIILSGIHWITNSLTFDENFKILIPFGLILIPLFLSLFFSIIILLIGPFLKMKFSINFFFSGFLSFSDFIKSKNINWFSMEFMGYSFSWSTEIIQILNIFGLFAFNLIINHNFYATCSFFFNKKKVYKKNLLFSLVSILFFNFYIYGNYSINKNKKILNYAKKFNCEGYFSKF